MMAYLELPLRLSTPSLSDSGDDDRLATFLISFDELFDGHVVDVDTLDRVSETGVVHFKNLVLAAPITI